MSKQLGATLIEVPIAEAVNIHFRDIGHDPKDHSVTYENGQARERTQVLMDIANKDGGMVIGTGDLSEQAASYGEKRTGAGKGLLQTGTHDPSVPGAL